MKLLASTIALSLAATASGHCWPCDGDGEFITDGASFGDSNVRITQLGQCMRCCNYILNNGYKLDEPFSDAVFKHRDHCKKIHCKDWQRSTEAGGSCAVQEWTAKDGTKIMRPFCPTEHRCECQGGTGPASCVGPPNTWSGWAGDYGCTKTACKKIGPEPGKPITW